MIALFRSVLSRFVNDEAGATAIEYGLLAAGISVAIIAIVFNVGTELNDAFTTVKTCLESPTTCNAPASAP